MLEWLVNWSLFSAKALTVGLMVLIVLGFFAAILARGRTAPPPSEGYLTATLLNESYEEQDDIISEALLDEAQIKLRNSQDKKRRKSEQKQRLKAAKAQAKKGGETIAPKERTIFVADFEGDVEASDVATLRKIVTAVIRNAQSGDEFLLRLESPGGSVTGYGLAAAQLERVKKAGVQLTVCVDQVAASGGYMMAVVANRILCAPFAVIGSIGVVTEIPNLHRLLKKHDVDYDVYTAGVNKRPVSVLGENTPEGIQKLKDDLAEIHGAFKDHVVEHRRNIDIDQLAEGDIWLGEKACELGLVDEIRTSDDYLMRHADSAKLIELKYVHPKTLGEKLGLAGASMVKTLSQKVSTQMAKINVLS